MLSTGRSNHHTNQAMVRNTLYFVHTVPARRVVLVSAIEEFKPTAYTYTPISIQLNMYTQSAYICKSIEKGLYVQADWHHENRKKK